MSRSRVKVGELLRLIKHSLIETHSIDNMYTCETLRGTTNLVSAKFWTGGRHQYLLGEIIVNSRNLNEDNMPYIALECLKMFFFNDQNVYDLTPSQIYFITSLGTDFTTAKSHSTPMPDSWLALGELGLIDVDDADRHGREWKAILTQSGVEAVQWLKQVPELK